MNIKHTLLGRGQNTKVNAQGYTIPQKVGYLKGTNLYKNVQNTSSFSGDTLKIVFQKSKYIVFELVLHDDTRLYTFVFIYESLAFVRPLY